jgi:hypothetical protein
MSRERSEEEKKSHRERKPIAQPRQRTQQRVAQAIIINRQPPTPRIHKTNRQIKRYCVCSAVASGFVLASVNIGRDSFALSPNAAVRMAVVVGTLFTDSVVT